MGRIGQTFGQGLFHHGGGQFFVGRAGINARDGGDHGVALARRCATDFRFKCFAALGHPVQADQDLQHIPVGITRARQGLGPGPCRCQGWFGRAAL